MLDRVHRVAENRERGRNGNTWQLSVIEWGLFGFGRPGSWDLKGGTGNGTPGHHWKWSNDTSATEREGQINTFGRAVNKKGGNRDNYTKEVKSVASKGENCLR